MTSWPTDPNTYVDARQVAARLGYRTLKTFYGARAKLAGFPEPALPRRWRASQIERWETWNAARASAPADAANENTPVTPKPPASIDSSPAHQRLAEIRRAAGLS